MGLDRVLAYKKIPGEFAVARGLGYQFEHFKLAARDAEVLAGQLGKTISDHFRITLVFYRMRVLVER